MGEKNTRKFQEFDSSNWIRGFQKLMQFRVRDVLLVSSLYDLYVFEEDGRLYELIRKEYQGLNLSNSPEITRVTTGREAIALVTKEKRFDLIITTQHIEDMSPVRFAQKMKKSGNDIPVVLLAYDNRELTDLSSQYDTSILDGLYIWGGNFRIIIAIIKIFEDKYNVKHDTNVVGVQSIILIEDNVLFYSTFLPILYTEVLRQSQELINEGINLSHKYLRMRARPKIIHFDNYDEAWKFFKEYEDNILGIISDVDFKRKGIKDPHAGLRFARKVKQKHSDIPILLQSDNQDIKSFADKVNASFLIKNSDGFLLQLSEFTRNNFGFGDFVFKDYEGRTFGRATDLDSLEEHLRAVPNESILFHSERNHFSNWLKARTEFGLADKLRPRKVSDFANVRSLRNNLITSLIEYRRQRKRGSIIDFSKSTFDPEFGVARIGGGSLGGKARGLSFINTLIHTNQLSDYGNNIKIYVPPSLVLATDVFDEFLEANNLIPFALDSRDDTEIIRRFIATEYFPQAVVEQLNDFLDIIHEPISVRSSSLMEDSQYHPFAGVYHTYMLPNNNPDTSERVNELLTAIKKVYASTFLEQTKNYFKVTSYSLEEEKMAVIIQKVVGTNFKNERFYPDFAGVAKSFNYYPVHPQLSTDGIVHLALGLGKMVVDGGSSVKFCPRYPGHLPQFVTIEDSLDYNQKNFFALNLKYKEESIEGINDDNNVEEFSIDVAEEDGSLYFSGSTYSHDNHAIYDGLSRKGMRIVNFAPVLKNKIFPLPDVLELLLDLGKWGMGTPVEIEFAVNMSSSIQRREIGVLQVRPMVLQREMETLRINEKEISEAICFSENVMGNGIVKDIHDIIFVDFHRFERSKSRQVADEISYFNNRLISEGRQYVLIGVGRWGSLDPWLGIPVTWEKISGARAIVESNFKDFMVSPSQGSHFFQNLTSFLVGYFTIDSFKEQGFVDWDWLLKQEATEKREFSSLLRFVNPLQVKMNGRENIGIICKPSLEEGRSIKD